MTSRGRGLETGVKNGSAAVSTNHTAAPSTFPDKKSFFYRTGKGL